MSKAKSKGDVEGSIDRRFDKLTDPKQPRIPERQSKGPLIDGSTSSPILSSPGSLSSVEGFLFPGRLYKNCPGYSWGESYERYRHLRGKAFDQDTKK